MPNLVRANAWVTIQLPSENVKVLQVLPNTTISLGKYGLFPSNLIIDRPYHLTYEIQDKRPDENFSRLRVIPASEIHADTLAEEFGQKTPPPDEDGETEAATEAAATAASADVIAVQDGSEYTLVDKTSGDVIARSGKDEVEAQARQMLTMDEIEELKKQDTDGGKNIIAKLMLSHTALAEKTSFSLSKYKILKNKKYLRRFQVLPLHPSTLGQYILEDKDAAKVLEMRSETLSLLGSWGNAHRITGATEPQTRIITNNGEPCVDDSMLSGKGRWLVVDDTGGIVVASVAEKLGILHQNDDEDDYEDETEDEEMPTSVPEESTKPTDLASEEDGEPAATESNGAKDSSTTHPNDFEVNLALNNTITVVHMSGQPNLAMLRYWNCDMATGPVSNSTHPLHNHLFPLSWLQLIDPQSDMTYRDLPAEESAETLAAWKPSKRGNYHRKRRRWARTKFMVDQARAGDFSGLIVASNMDVISILRATLPLLAGGAPISIYSPTVEPLSELADCFTVSRRGAWSTNPPPETEGMTQKDVESWEGSEEFPINPTLVLGANVQTMRAKRWQVLPGRTHPLMMGRGGAEGYLFTGTRAVPAEGKVEARGKFKRRKTEA